MRRPVFPWKVVFFCSLVLSMGLLATERAFSFSYSSLAMSSPWQFPDRSGKETPLLRGEPSEHLNVTAIPQLHLDMAAPGLLRLTEEATVDPVISTTTSKNFWFPIDSFRNAWRRGNSLPSHDPFSSPRTVFGILIFPSVNPYINETTVHAVQVLIRSTIDSSWDDREEAAEEQKRAIPISLLEGWSQTLIHVLSQEGRKVGSAAPSDPFTQRVKSLIELAGAPLDSGPKKPIQQILHRYDWFSVGRWAILDGYYAEMDFLPGIQPTNNHMDSVAAAESDEKALAEDLQWDQANFLASYFWLCQILFGSKEEKSWWTRLGRSELLCALVVMEAVCMPIVQRFARRVHRKWKRKRKLRTREGQTYLK